MKEKKTIDVSKTDPIVQKNIETIRVLERDALQNLSAAENIANKVTAFAGSTPIIIFHILWFGGWILVNSGIFSNISPFDPFPFSFLTLVVSLEAIFLTLLVLMSQNRMSKEADKRAHLDLQINMLDEQESTKILKIVHNIAEHLGLESETDDSLKELSEETDIQFVAKSIDSDPTIS
jgi:uncharacterized membrane protein